MFVVRFPNLNFLKADSVLPPKILIESTIESWKDSWWKRLGNASTDDPQKARIFTSEKAAKAAVHRSGITKFYVIPVTIKLPKDD